MDENLSRGYVHLGKSRRIKAMKFSNEFDHESPPVDRYNFVYIVLLLSGVGFLLPYNSFVIAVDYFQARYPGTTVIFDMSVVYISMAFIAVCANNILVETVPLNTRIAFGYLVSLGTLNSVVISEIWWQLFGITTLYTINLVAVAIVSIGCTVQQSSFYGYTSMLPSRYTQAVMVGESAAGLWVSINRILTKSIIDDERGNTSMFFVLSIMTICMVSVLFGLAKRTEFVQFYVNHCQKHNKITLEPTEDIGLMDPLDQSSDSSKGQYGVLKLQTSPLTVESGGADPTTGAQYSAFSFSNPVYEPNAPSANPPNSTGPTYKVEDVVVINGEYGSQSSKRWSGMKRGLLARIEVAKLIYPHMATIGVTYFITLSLYPGIVSEIISCKMESWMPVLLMAVFNGGDLLGKVYAASPCEWTTTQLLYFSCARIILIPLFLLCAIPRHAPIISTECFPLFFSWTLGITNGIVGSVPMIRAPSKVPEEYRELGGNIMTLSYTTGLTLGSLLAYVLDACLGPPVTANQICPKLTKTTTLIGNITTTITSNIVNTTLAPVVMKISKIPIVPSTTAALTTILTSSAITNATMTLLGTAISNSTTTTTTMAMPLLTNVTSTISNAILQH